MTAQTHTLTENQTNDQFLTALTQNRSSNNLNNSNNEFGAAAATSSGQDPRQLNKDQVEKKVQFQIEADNSQTQSNSRNSGILINSITR